MSAFRIAIDSAQADQNELELERSDDPGGGGGAHADAELPKSVLDQLTKWIPGDTLAIYAPGVTLISSPGTPSVVFLVCMIVLTPLFVIGVAYSKNGAIGRNVLLSAGLSAVAFAIWAISVPLNGWQAIPLIADNKGVAAVAAGVAGILFGYFAEGLSKRH